MKKKEKGIIKIIILIIIIIFVLGYLNIDLHGILNKFKENPEIESVTEILKQTDNENFLKSISNIWDIFLNTIIEQQIGNENKDIKV
jgi:uncharacterized protein YehS (DUF1456 family)